MLLQEPPVWYALELLSGSSVLLVVRPTVVVVAATATAKDWAVDELPLGRLIDFPVFRLEDL